MTCFATGSLISTKQGDVRVEDLRPGQMVLTQDHGFQPVRWVGIKRMTSRFLLDNPHLKPVLIRQEAFGAGLPERDTMLSPNTRLPVIEESNRFLSGGFEEMVAVKNLIDHKGVQQIDTIGIDYVHIMFENHEIVAVNGFWCESFKSGDYSLNAIGNSQRNEIFEVFPELRASQARKVAREADKKTSTARVIRK